MGLLENKTALIFGVANDHSIAWGIAQALAREGATLAFSYAGEALERRVRPLAAKVGSTFVEPCDVTKDEDIAVVMQKAGDQLGGLDVMVHAVAYAGRDALSGPYYNVSRAAFLQTLDISCYSFTGLIRESLPHMRPNGSYLTLSYYGAEKAVPHYNVMGVAKAALEASVRYLAADLGPLEKALRVNAISAGPIRTLSAAGVAGFKAMHSEFKAMAPLRRHVTIDDIGNAALYLCSDLAAGVTGEVHYVDAGYNVIGVPEPPSKSE